MFLRWSAFILLLVAAPAVGQTINAPTINGSVSIATGNTFQQALAALGAPPAIRRSLTVQNNNTTTDACWVYLGTTANATKATAIELLQGQAYSRYFPYVPSDAVQVTCATTADTVYVDTQ